MPVDLVYDSAYLKHDTGCHPANLRRLQAILQSVEGDESLSKRLARITPQAASTEDIARCHEEDLIQNIETLCRQGARFVDVDTTISPESYEVARLAAGAAISAVDRV